MLEAIIVIHAIYWTAGSLISMTFGAVVTYFVVYTAKRMQ